jgi:uncharacterized protein
MSQQLSLKFVKFILILFALWVGFTIATRLIVESFWFQEVGYFDTFLLRLKTKVGLGAIASIISLFLLLINLNIADKYKWNYVPENKPKSNQLLPQTPVLKLPFLIAIIFVFSFLSGLILLYYGEIVTELRQLDFSLPNIIPPLPSPFKVIAYFSKIAPKFSENIFHLSVLIATTVLIITQVKLTTKIIAGVLSLFSGFILSANWTRFLQYFNPTEFNQNDPIFTKDISFYIFDIPFWQLLDFWLSGLFLYALISCCLIYLLSAKSLSEGKFPGFSTPQLQHIYILSGLFMFTLSLRHWLRRYELLNSARGVTYGASFTDLHIELPIQTNLAFIAIIIGLWLIFKTIFHGKNRFRLFLKENKSVQKTTPLFVGVIVIYLLLNIVGFFSSLIVQRIAVQPNELAREKPYIQRSIAYTRKAFGLDNIEAKTFDPEDKLTIEDIQKNYLTIENIRLWDTRPILQTNRQLQQIRLYYKFNDADIDRYNLTLKKNNQNIVTEKQQIIIAPRELDYTAVPKAAQTWVNEHLVYTHGYGFTMSPVNKVAEAGLPDYYVKDIGTGNGLDQEGNLNVSNQLIPNTIPLGKPRIYYGELTNNYVLTGTNSPEFDFPSGEDNVYNKYDGKGGIPIKNISQRLLFASYLNDWRIIFAQNFTPETKLLFRRNINNRVRAIAPFLHYDKNPYLVVADGGDTNLNGEKNYLYWVIDAYTTTDHYPYSDPGNNSFNYIRNSVKVVINAYNGSINFYISDQNDPILQTWQKIFPSLFKPMEKMPENLFYHIRYPTDLFTIQSERLLSYHMTDPQVFYNREDQWEIPQEIYGNKSQPITPYYLIMKLPTANSEEFILLHPYTPISRPNLIAWLAGRSDGDEYGKLLLYQFPKQKLIYGPDQVEALINQDPVISQQISLWNREGSRAIQGNLLVIPIDQSLLYVEPLYLEAERNSVPTLVKVIVVYENKIIMADNLSSALTAVFTPKKEENTAIIRPLNN